MSRLPRSIEKDPPLEQGLDLSPYSISGQRGQVTNIDVVTDGAIQWLPVGVNDPMIPKEGPQSVLLRLFPWSMSNAIQYQQDKSQILANVTGVPVISPNTIGQGQDSPDLTDVQSAELRNGITDEDGRVMLQASIRAYEENHGPVRSMSILAESQGASLLPGIISSLSSDVRLNSVLAISASAFRKPPEGLSPENMTETDRVRLLRRFYRVVIEGSGIHLATYLANNPEHLRSLHLELPDWHSTAQQRAAHLIDYPALALSGKVTPALKLALEHRRDTKFYMVHGSEDGIILPEDNLAAADELQAYLYEAQGHYHAMFENLPFLSRILKEAIEGHSGLPPVFDSPRRPAPRLA